MYKNVQVYGKYVFYGFDGASGVWFVREPLFLTVAYTLVQTNDARSAFCDSCAIPRHITPVQPSLLWTSRL